MTRSINSRQVLRLGQLISQGLVILAASVIVVPLVIMIFGSLKTPARAVQFSLSLPTELLFSNYAYVIERANMVRAFMNSLIVTTFSVVICIVCSALIAFLVARKKSRFTRFLSNYYLMGMIAPFQVITTFALLQLLRLNGTYLGVILVFVSVTMSWSVFLFTGFIASLPRELDEAAFIDGYSPMRMFFAIILPLIKPITVTVIVMDAMSVWNDFQIPLYFFNTSSRWTLPLTVYNFFGRYFNYWNYVFANLVLVALPITIVYLLCQRYIIAGMTAGAIKG